MTSPDDVVTRSGQKLTRRVWDMLDTVERDLGVTVEVGQGGYKGSGGGADASAGTHDVGDVFDVRLTIVNESRWVELNTALRAWNACAWVRSPAYGWTSSGPHIHGVMRDSADGLSSGARSQVADYDAHRNGLANNGPDPFPRPTQRPYVMGAPAPGQATEDDVLLKYTDDHGKSTYWLLSGGRMTSIGSDDAVTFTGVRMNVTDEVTWERMTGGYPLNR